MRCVRDTNNDIELDDVYKQSSTQSVRHPFLKRNPPPRTLSEIQLAYETGKITNT